MEQASVQSGVCLCGSVEIKPGKFERHAGICHCAMCRIWGGGPFMSVAGGKSPVIKGSGHITVYRSSAWAERAFCARCGTHLFYRNTDTGDHYVAAGLFPDAPLELHHQIFIDKKPDWYAFAGDSDCLTEAEVLARHAS